MIVENTSVEQALARVLKSAVFARAPRQAQLLRYLAERSAAGEGAALKESVIAVDVFGRDPSYDPKLDSVVRVEISKLRTRLDQYYSAEGATDELRFVIPKGGYAVQFEPLAPAPSAAAAPEPATTQRPRGQLALWIALAGGACVLTVFAIVEFRSPSRPITTQPVIAVLLSPT